jgi:hypothetical protein
VIKSQDSVFASRPKEDEPEDAEDQHGKSRRDCEKREHRRSGFALPGLGRGFDDLTLLSRCHGSLD